MKKLSRLIRGVSREFVSRPGEALLLCRMAWWVAVLSVTSRCYSLPRALQIVAGNQTKNVPSKAPIDREQLARAIDRLLSADVLMFRPVCWKRAAVLHRYLLRNGVSTRIIFGVRNETGGTVAGHAWLEADGQPILESSPPEYVVTYSFPGVRLSEESFVGVALRGHPTCSEQATIQTNGAATEGRPYK